MIPAVRECSEQLAFGTRLLKRVIQGLTPEQLAHVPAGLTNSIASLALHIAATEASASALLGGRQVPAGLRHDLRLDRYLPGPGSPIPAAEPGETSEGLLAKQDGARALLAEALQSLTEADLERSVPFGGGKPVPVSFLLSLLPFHLASHYGQIQVVRRFLQ